MAKALKVVIVIILLLSIAALVLGIVLFSQRGTLKGRTQKTEQAIVSIAGKLHFEGLDVAMLKDYKQMQAPLDQVTVAAENRYEELQNTKADLETTRGELTKTKDDLAKTRTELDVSKAKVTELTDNLEAKEAELAQSKGRVDQLEQDKAGLQTQIDEMNNQLVKSEEEMRDCQDQVATLDKIIKDMEASTGGKKLLPVGLTGRIIAVNPDWNFVILDLGSDSGLVPGAEMIVHRGDQLVGRVHISAVQKNMAVAEILSDWEQAPVQEGDNVLF